MGSQWTAILAISSRIGCPPQSLHRWMARAERDQGKRPGLSTADRDWLKDLERENRELKRANEILRTASAYFAQAEVAEAVQV